ncbi:MAG: uroporphyrinogen-III C-methyltransferase [Deltaproteobacteria bacterium]|nr:uroporphyrinogen-III C-methyltransferase [Deltaproteobacteria bacterium]
MKVYLIGAGPGDPGLLTLKGKEILTKVDVVIYDYLANSSFLDYAKAGAELIYAGKRGGQHALPQKEINQLVIDKFREGKSVARLKGGDPYIFGRGGEEAVELAAQDIPFEVVPGVTSAIASAAYAGIPVTHRGYASSLIIATGHEDPLKQHSTMEWASMVKSGATLIFLMGMHNLEGIVDNLLQAGMPPKMLAAVIHHGTTPSHRSLVSTVKNLPADVKKRGFTAPALIIIGKVVKFRDQLNWFEKKPLFAKGIVVTRARDQFSDIAALLSEQGANVIQFPTIEIKALPDYSEVRKAIAHIGSYDWVAFTSVNGVKFFWEQLYALGLDTRVLAPCRIAAIGPATAQALKNMGVVANFIPERFVSESVVQGLTTLGIKDKRILIPRAVTTRDVLQKQLKAAGATVDVLHLYETMPSDANREELLELLEKGAIQCITFASSSTVDNFMKLLSAKELKQFPDVRYACIGPITAQTLQKYGITCDFQPVHFTIQDLVKILVEKL